MELEEIQNEYQETLKILADITGKKAEDLDEIIKDSSDIEELLNRVSEIFDEQ